MHEKQVVIRRKLKGTILLTFTCAIFTALGLLVIQLDTDMAFLGIVVVIFAGGGGLAYLLLMSHKPIITVSSRGITVPYGWGKNFTAWDNVTTFQVVEQKIRYGQTIEYIGIYVIDKAGITGTGDTSKRILKGVTGWQQQPDILVNLSYTSVPIEDVMAVLQDFHNEYRNMQAMPVQA